MSGIAQVHQRRNAGVSPLRRQSAPPSVEMTIILLMSRDNDLSGRDDGDPTKVERRIVEVRD
jgi:hypothetical protein